MNNNLDGFIPYKKGTRGRGHRNELASKPGCFAIIVNRGEKLYIGNTIRLGKLISISLSQLKYNRHGNKNLQEAYNRNPDVVVMVKLTETIEQARQLVQEIVDKLLPSGKLCNIGVTDVTRPRLGVPASKESREKMAEAKRGHKASEETRLKMSKARLGKPLSAEIKHKISAIQKERYATDDGKAAHARGTEKIKHQVMCDGTTYSSIAEAARKLGINVGTIIHRCKSDKYPNFYKINKSTQPVD